MLRWSRYIRTYFHALNYTQRPHPLVFDWSWRRTLTTTIKVDPPALVPEETIRLRQYQEECIQSVLSYLSSGHKRLGISLATGSGKTVVFTQLIDRITPPNAQATQTLILAHRRELVEQAAKQCARAYPGKTIEIEMGTQKATGDADITIASVRSLQTGDRLEKYDPGAFKLILVDEAHHIVAPGYLDILEHFGLDQARNIGPALVGVSATFSRFDGLRLGAAIDHIVYHKDYVDMIGEKWLCDVMFTTIKSKVNLSRVKTNKDGDFATSELSRAVNTNEANEITVKSWMSEAGGRKSTLVFCVDIAHVKSLCDTFRHYGVNAQYVTGNTKKQIRAERLEAFKQGQFPVLLNCGVFTEGTDIPSVDCVLLARPTRSRNLLVQMIGRGMRLHPSKENCHVIDMVASLETGIVTVPTLFGLDPGEVVKKASSAALRDLKDQNSQAQQAQNSEGSRRNLDNSNVTLTHYESVEDLINDTSGERHIRALSPNAWVQIDAHKYILASKGGILTVDRRHQSASSAKDATALPSYHVIWKHSLPPLEKSKSPWSKPRTVATASSLSDALHAADTFAATKFERLFIATSSSWRKEPASEGQLAFLNRFRIVNEQSLLEPEDITRGMAGDMITKMKFGARGRFDRLMVQKRQAAKEMEREQSLRAREEVRVGPLLV